MQKKCEKTLKLSNKDLIEFTLHYNKYKTQLYNFALKMTPDKMIAEDVIQNVFLKFFENIHKINNKSAIKNWLYTSTRNEIYTYFRKRKTRKTDSLDSNEINQTTENQLNLANSIEQKDFKDLILKKINEIPFEQREVFLLKEYGNFTYKEISEMLEISSDLVKSRLYKTRQKLITFLKTIMENENSLEV